MINNSYHYFMLVLFLAQFIVDKIFFADERKMSDTQGNKLYLWGMWIFAAAVVITTFSLDMSQLQPLFGILIALSFGFRAYMEWRYIRETKSHLVSLVLVTVSLIFTFAFFILR
ncbi:DUF4181 domain-containing protein [Paenibacillus caui]|uniref:DUF4181 domain-containing protein n=1 Tax=Paenibacillus caui TaxID=2873927 RepID=UPI001CA7E3E9|nr:DUF4181 domain-containing protein [Paenibacillus caui]